MSDPTASSSAPPPQNGGAAPTLTEEQILNGGIEINVIKIDGSSEKVKVRQLPISLTKRWAQLESQADEAGLVELLCDKIDRTTEHHINNLRLVEMRTQSILLQADIKQIEGIEKYLVRVREDLAKHEAKPRWSDSLTHESIAEIRTLGIRLNKKKYVDQLARNSAAAAAILEAWPASLGPNSSSPSAPSAEKPSAT